MCSEPTSRSSRRVASIGAGTGLHPDFGTVWEGAPNGIPYSVVDTGADDIDLVPVDFEYADESDPGPYWTSDDEDPALPPMGARFRLRADFDCSRLSVELQVICTALKRYGMFLADNGGDWFVSGAPDSRWDDERLHDIGEIPGAAFEAVDTGEPIVTPAGSD